MFPALANESNFKTDFVPANNYYDYDMIIDGHATQVKTLFSYDIFATNKVGRRKQEAYRLQFDKLRDMYDKHQITRKYVEQEIIKYIKHNCIDKINDALRKKQK
jgi:hypothetical protein